MMHDDPLLADDLNPDTRGPNDRPGRERGEVGMYGEHEPAPPGVRRIAVVTGTRAEFGLLRPVMHAILATPSLQLATVVTGAHFLKPAETWREVKREFAIAEIAVMQTPGRATRIDDAEAVGRGVSRLARAFDRLAPACVLVLGDRIEAFAAAAAASIGGIPLLHIHGGDRAEGVADEAMRHAISKLAHLHAAATPASAERLLRMGEDQWRVRVVGSPALDGLDAIPAMNDTRAGELGDPHAIFLLHPAGLPDAQDAATARAALAALSATFHGTNVLCLAPNSDPGREHITAQLDAAKSAHPRWTFLEHVPRQEFIALLKRLAHLGGVLVGNSSAGLIECAALGVPAVNILPRQAGREHFANAIHVEAHLAADSAAIMRALEQARALPKGPSTHTLGKGCAGPTIAAWLAEPEWTPQRWLRKRNSY